MTAWTPKIVFRVSAEQRLSSSPTKQSLDINTSGSAMSRAHAMSVEPQTAG
jgi:hypothetical protein